jgi:hypothetical protein
LEAVTEIDYVKRGEKERERERYEIKTNNQERQ